MNTKPKAYDAIITVRLPVDLIAKLEELRAFTGETVSEVIRTALAVHLGTTPK